MLKSLTIIAFCCVSLTACQWLAPSTDTTRTNCKEMKSRLTFNGQSINPSQNFSERSDNRLLAKDYHDECT